MKKPLLYIVLESDAMVLGTVRWSQGEGTGRRVLNDSRRRGPQGREDYGV